MSCFWVSRFFSIKIEIAVGLKCLPVLRSTRTPHDGHFTTHKYWYPIHTLRPIFISPFGDNSHRSGHGGLPFFNFQPVNGLATFSSTGAPVLESGFSPVLETARIPVLESLGLTMRKTGFGGTGTGTVSNTIPNPISGSIAAVTANSFTQKQSRPCSHECGRQPAGKWHNREF